MEYQRALVDWASHQVRSEIQELTWKLFRMTAVEGKKAEQVSQELGVPIGSVYTAKCRVVARIRAKIANLDDDDVDCERMERMVEMLGPTDDPQMLGRLIERSAAPGAPRLSFGSLNWF